MIRVEGLRVRRGGRLVVEVDTLEVGEELVAVMGPNGAGKTSLLLALSGGLSFEGVVARRGTWFVRSEPPERVLVSPEALVAGHGVEDAGVWLKRVGYGGPGVVARGSAGERKLVALAGALGREGEAVLLDEPFGPLDPPHVARLVPVLRERSRGDPVVFSTHDVQAAARADRVVLLNGAVVADGSPREVLEGEPLSACYGSQVVVEWTRLGPIVESRGFDA